MKLSNIKGEAVFDVVADIMEPLANIAADPEAVKAFKPEEGTDAPTRVKAIATYLIKEHRADTVSILAALEQVSADEYLDGLTMAKLLTDVLDVITDDELISFL